MKNIDDILTERGKRYGSFKDGAQMIAGKISRILNGDAEYQDSWDDISGYAQLISKEISGRAGTIGVPNSIKMIIKSNEYEITEKDQFMGNGSCVQLLTQSKERTVQGGLVINPVLSRDDISYIGEFKRVELEHDYGEGVSIFTLALKEPDEK